MYSVPVGAGHTVKTDSLKSYSSELFLLEVTLYCHSCQQWACIRNHSFLLQHNLITGMLLWEITVEKKRHATMSVLMFAIILRSLPPRVCDAYCVMLLMHFGPPLLILCHFHSLHKCSLTVLSIHACLGRWCLSFRVSVRAACGTRKAPGRGEH